RDISRTAEAYASRKVSSESSHRVDSKSRKARGKARRFLRNRVCELEGRGEGVTKQHSPLAVGSRCKVK
ncbi:hypothetical protein PISMIDRAFT_689069, partial [Pisolithus microcarpus 441]